MRPTLTPTRVADDVFEFAVGSAQEAQTLSGKLRDAGLAEDVVAGLESVCVRFDPAKSARMQDWLTNISLEHSDVKSAAEEIEIEVSYGGDSGPDFEAVCEALNMSPAEFIALHTGIIHSVDMIGFTPGFAYISGLPRNFDIPRLSTPRVRVPAGSIGLSTSYTGIYALSGPGGWPLIGMTSAPLFDLARDAALLLEPGQRLKFKVV